MNKPSAEKIKNVLDKLKVNNPVYYNAIKYHKTSDTGQVMVFNNRPEAIWVYKVIHKYHNVVIQKCSQVGMTEMLFNLMMYYLKQGLRTMFLVRDDGWRHVYVQDRVNGLIKYVPYYKNNHSLDPTDPKSTKLKRFFNTTVRFAGVRNAANLFSTPAQVIIVDEFDLCNQENLVFADDRTGWKTHENQDDPYTVKIGNPTIENWGINKELKKVDQYYWHAECDHCGHQQRMEWTTHFVEKDDSSKSGWKLKDPKGNPVCTNCNKSFNRRGKGHYKLVNKGDKESSIGIHIDKLRWDVSKNAIKKLFIKWEEAQTSIIAKEHFYNQELGLPYEAGEHRITKTMLLECAVNGPLQMIKPDELKANTYVGVDGVKHKAAAESLVTVVAGLDQGHSKGNHLNISIVTDKGVRHKIFIGRVFSLKEFEQKLDDYNVSTCVIDAAGGGFGYNELRDLCSRRPGQVYLCRYRAKSKTEAMYKIDEDHSLISANRTDSLDGSFDAYKNKKVILPQNYADIDGGQFVEQMVESVRTKEVDKNNTIIGVWKNTGPDDYRHSDNYEYIAQCVAGYSNADVYEGEESGDLDIIDDNAADDYNWDVFQ